MDLISLNYAAFVSGVLLGFQLCPTRYRPALLCVASFVFYSLYSLVSALFLLAITAWTFRVAQGISRTQDAVRRRWLLSFNIALLLTYLVVIKLLPVMRTAGYRPPGSSLLVAVGVSYYTFKLVGYLVDVYWGKYAAWGSFADFTAFVAFFPQLPAGPIQRASEWSIAADSADSADLMVAGLRRMLLGYVKKVVVADQLGSLLAFISSVQPSYTNLTWIAAYVFPIQLYADFSALTDIAVGTAALFGITSPENFDFPFFAPSISQFWRRWHMSLTRWLTDYVFVPLRMATRNLGKFGLALSITINMTLIGLWHGFSMGCLLFGLLHSIFLVADSFTAQNRRRYYRAHAGAERLTDILGPFVTFQMIALSLVLFRAESMDMVIYNLQHLFDGITRPLAAFIIIRHGYGGARSLSAFIGLLAFVVTEVILYLRKRQWKLSLQLPRFARWPAVFRWSAYYIAIILVATMHQSDTHFIYVQF